MTTERRRGPETRWYEPPTPRAWHPNSSELQRLEAAAHLRKTLLEATPTGSRDAGALRRNSKVSLEKGSLDKGLLPQNLRGSTSSLSSMAKGPLNPPLGRVRKDHDKDFLASMPNLSRQQTPVRSSSESDFSATFVLKNKYKSQNDVRKAFAKTPPSRPRSSSLTKYEPLPNIRHSAPNQEVRSKSEGESPMPRGGAATLQKGLRSPWAEPPSPWAEFSKSQGQARQQGQVKSPWTVPPTPRGASDSNNNQGMAEPPPMIRSKTFDVFETKLTNLPVVDSEPEDNEGGDSRIVSVSIEGKSLTEFLTHAKDGLLMSRPGTRYGRNAEPSQGQSSQHEKEDIFLYIKLPDDSLLLTSSPHDRTLGQLLEVVASMHVGGYNLLIADDGLEDDDLDKTLLQLGITDNATLHLMFLPD
ncbi:uncharacterized protein LOC125042071 [Penaeus chinensis]|uniref:uncharacterized protein LOC125042071 n=1 Tax=Penaeus chinensis TaxID=139456 RepID=UPI001FB68FC7|nr:uncharacterized protein LOC125042071 [Penaeus chinensis]